MMKFPASKNEIEPLAVRTHANFFIGIGWI